VGELYCWIAKSSSSHTGKTSGLPPDGELPLESAFDSEFVGMILENITLETLERTQGQITSALPQALTPSHHVFLLAQLPWVLEVRMGINDRTVRNVHY